MARRISDFIFERGLVLMEVWVEKLTINKNKGLSKENKETINMDDRVVTRIIKTTVDAVSSTVDQS